MAAPSDITLRSESRANSELDTLRAEYNKLATNFRTLCTKLDNDATVTDANYFALCADTTSSGPALVTAL